MTLPRSWAPVLASSLLAACIGAGHVPTAGYCPPSIGRPTLLRLDCRGELVPGLARWEVQGSAVFLELEGPDPEARDLIRSWPAADEAPWLGHALVGATVLTPQRIRVEFRGPWPPPARLFADPRLAPVEDASGDPNADARDQIDRGEEPVRTRHERSVDYARSLGRQVIREGFDRRYHVVLARSASEAEGRSLERSLREAWTRGGVAGSRRLPGEDPIAGAEECAPVGGARRPGGLPSSSGAVTVSYPVGDPVAREIAERLVSASLPGGAAEWIALEGLRIRGYDRTAGSAVGPSDVATVVPVAVGPVHRCSTWGELQRAESWFGNEAGSGGVGALTIGETAVFRIEAERMEG